jgi:hypothetical protein
MATITLDRDECGEGFLPPVCVRCGEAAPNSQSQTFHWFPPAVYLALIPVCTLPLYIILVLILRKTRTVRLPVCSLHRGLWLQRRVLTILGVLAMILGVWIGAIFDSEIKRTLDINNPLIASSVTGLVIGLVLIGLSGIGSVRPVRITDRLIKLKGVSPVFADTVEQYRILLEDDDD